MYSNALLASFDIFHILSILQLVIQISVIFPFLKEVRLITCVLSVGHLVHTVVLCSAFLYIWANLNQI